MLGQLKSILVYKPSVLHRDWNCAVERENRRQDDTFPRAGHSSLGGPTALRTATQSKVYVTSGLAMYLEQMISVEGLQRYELRTEGDFGAGRRADACDCRVALDDA